MTNAPPHHVGPAAAGGSGQILSHTGLRGIAALLVVAYHLQFGSDLLALESRTLFFKRSYLLVDLFFVLSGFIISLSNRQSFARSVGRRDYADFLARRVARLYPLLAFTLVYLVAGQTAINAVYEALGRPRPFDLGSPAILIAQATLTNAWLANPAGWNLPSWSISAEMFAYFLFPVLLMASARHARAGGLLLAALALPFYLFIAATTRSLDIIGGLAPLRCLAGFSAGMLVYQYRRLFVLGGTALAALQLAAVGAIVVLLALPVNDVLLLPCFVVLVGATWQDRGPAGRLLSTPLPVWLGTLSYSVYLNHVCLMQLMGVPWRSAERMLGPDPVLARSAWIAACFIVILAFSRITYRWVEIPGRQWLATRLLQRRLRPITTAPPAP